MVSVKNKGKKMPRRWSKLQRRIHAIFDPNICLQFHCAIYRIPGHVDSVCPRYFLMLNGEIIWDWPRDYIDDISYEEMHLVYRESASKISDSIADYLNSGREAILSLRDNWGIWDIFRSADRRIGRKQWDDLLEDSNPKVSTAVERIITARKNSGKSSMKNKNFEENKNE